MLTIMLLSETDSCITRIMFGIDDKDSDIDANENNNSHDNIAYDE